MITLTTDSNAPLRIHQSCTPPTIYLDHWAIRKLSENKNLRSRFVTSVQDKYGTVALSWLNLVEFSRISDNAQVLAAGEMVQNLFPNLFFMEINPFTVIDNEDKLLSGADPFPPHADKELLKAFFLLEQKTPCPYDAVQLFQIAQESVQSGELDSLADTIVTKMVTLKESIQKGTDRQLTRRKTQITSPSQAGTRYILREAMRQIFLNSKASVKRNDAIDLMHTVVPVSYCDTVLIDGRWRDLVDRIRRVFESQNKKFPIARVYSEKRDGLDNFLRDI